MKKYSSRFCVLLIISIIMMAVSCGKSDTTEEVKSTIESSGDKAAVEEKEPSEIAETTLTAEPKVTLEPKVTAEPTVTADPTVSVEPTVSAELTEVAEPTVTETLESVDPNISSELETIEETVLFDQDGVRVTAKEFITDYWGKAISVLIENDTDRNIGIVSSYFVVNNYMVMNFPFSEIAPGTESNDVIPLSSADLAVKGITTISEVAINFQVFDNDSGENLFYTEEAVIPTSAYGIFKQPAMEGGKELINQDGLKIVGKYIDENSNWGKGVLLYLHNTTQQDILIQCDDMLINGISIYPFFLYQVNFGREALEPITFMDFDLENNNITKINTIELTFSYMDPYNQNVINAFGPVEVPIGN